VAETWSSAICLTKFNQLSGRLVANDPMTDAQKYVRLSDAQNEVIQDIAPRCPKALVSKAVAASTPTLSTSDNKIFTFGTDISTTDAQFPIGRVRIFQALADIPDHPWVEGVDYLVEGTQIRIPNNRTHSSTLYWRGMAAVANITAAVAPSILPPPARVLLCYRAAQILGEESGRDRELADRMGRLYDEAFRRWCLVWKTQFSSGTGRGIVSGLDLAMLYG
jgi:hypothetical protein